EKRFEFLSEKLQDPSLANNVKEYRELMKEYSSLEKIVGTYRQYKGMLDGIAQSKDILENESDEEIRDLAKQELQDLESRRPQLEEDLKILLIPKDPKD